MLRLFRNGHVALDLSVWLRNSSRFIRQASWERLDGELYLKFSDGIWTNIVAQNLERPLKQAVEEIVRRS